MVLIKKILLLNILFTFVCFAQPDEYDIIMVRGDKTIIRLVKNNDYTGKELTFGAKLSTDIDADRLIQKQNTLAGGDSSQIYATYHGFYSEILITLLPEDHQDLIVNTLYYDVEAVDVDDSTNVETILTGTITLTPDVLTPMDGLELAASGVRIFTVALPEATNEGSIYVGYNSDNSMKQVSYAGLADTLAVYLDTSAFDPGFPILMNTGNTAHVISKSAFRDTIGIGWVSVKDYGATGDGSTDDLTAINNTIDYVSGLGGGTVYFPGIDTFMIGGSILIKSNVNLLGNGATIRLMDNTNLMMVEGVVGLDNIEINGIIFDGNHTNQTGSAIYGIYFQSSTNIEIYNIKVKNTLDECLFFTNTSGDNENISVLYSAFEDNGAGVMFRATNNLDFSHNLVKNWAINGGTEHGFNMGELSGQGNAVISNNIFQRDNTGGTFSIQIYSTTSPYENATISDNVCDGTNGYTAGMSIAVKNSVISNNVIVNGAGQFRSGIEIWGYDNIIEGNRIENGVIALTNVGTILVGGLDILNNVFTYNSASISSVIKVGAGTYNRVTISGGKIDMQRETNCITIGSTGVTPLINDLTIDNVKIFSQDSGNGGAGISLNVANGSKNIDITNNKIDSSYIGIQNLSTSYLTDVNIFDNRITNTTDPVSDLSSNSVNVVYKRNTGHLTSNSDTVVTTNDNSITDSVITVTHGLSITPTIDKILTPALISSLGSASYYYVLASDITSTTFKIRLNADAGQVVRFNWQITD